jgi:diguanylate cyclase (GGDEF)-like protein
MGNADTTTTQEALAASQKRDEVIATARRATVGLVIILGIVTAFGTWIAGTVLPDASDLQIALVACAAAFVVVGVPFMIFNRAAGMQQRKISAESAANEQRMLVEARWRRFEAQLANALEMSDGEDEALEAVEHALHATLPDSPAEFLLADNSHAHLRRMVTSSPTGEAPGCPVDSPENCPAARRAQVQRFADSNRLDACPKLRNRQSGDCSAVCVPVSIMGRTVGVIHATGAVNQDVSDETIQDLQTLANQAGTRIGLLRIMAETQLQAATDSLTGLLNRRALENKVHELRAEQTSYVLAMADLDHFKLLNDTYGHETGDRALRLFAQTMRAALRGEDLVCRHGGEEFAVVLPGCTLVNGASALEQVRTKLAAAIQEAGLPNFTVSMGLVEASDDEDLVKLIERADRALFEAKRMGRDRIITHGGSDLDLPSDDADGHENGRVPRALPPMTLVND